jgi:hypothetical protein
MSFFFRRKRPVYQIDVDEKKTWVVYDRVLELLKELDLSGTDLSYDATVRDHPLLEIEITFQASHENFYDCMEFWVEPGDDVQETCGWVERELSKTIERRRQELEGSPAGRQPDPSSQELDHESVDSEQLAEYDARCFKFFVILTYFSCLSGIASHTAWMLRHNYMLQEEWGRVGWSLSGLAIDMAYVVSLAIAMLFVPWRAQRVIMFSIGFEVLSNILAVLEVYLLVHSALYVLFCAAFTVVVIVTWNAPKRQGFC